MCALCLSTQQNFRSDSRNKRHAVNPVNRSILIYVEATTGHGITLVLTYLVTSFPSRHLRTWTTNMDPKISIGN